jgi:hypothetical protein
MAVEIRQGASCMLQRSGAPRQGAPEEDGSGTVFAHVWGKGVRHPMRQILLSCVMFTPGTTTRAANG